MITFVTAADYTHAVSAERLVRQIGEFYPESKCFFWDLGCPPDDLLKIQEASKMVEVVEFPYSEFPERMNVKNNCGFYAWKPIVIRETSQKTKGGMLVWCDAGTLLLDRLTEEMEEARKKGVYVSLSGFSTKSYTHPGTFFFMNATKDEIDSEMVMAGFIIFDQGELSKRIVDKYCEFAIVKACIAPYGAAIAAKDKSDKRPEHNHRGDQCVLSVLVKRLGIRPGKVVNWKSHQDIDTRGVNYIQI